MEFKLKKLLSVHNKIEKEFDTTTSSYGEIVGHMDTIIKDHLLK